MKTKILIMLAVWKRPEVLQLCLNGIKRLQAYKPDKYDIQPFAVVSTDDDARVLLNNDIPFCVFPNNMGLGAKHNVGIHEAMQRYEFDYFMQLGSDDLATNEYLDLCAPHFEDDTPYICPNTCYFYDLRTSAQAMWTTNLVLGAGRIIHRRILNQMVDNRVEILENICGPNSYTTGQIVSLPGNQIDSYLKHGLAKKVNDNGFCLWPEDINRGLDTGSHKNILAAGYKCQYLNTLKPYLVDIKSDVNIWPIDNFIPIKKEHINLPAIFPELANYKSN